MPGFAFAVTPAERAAIDAIPHACPEAAAARAAGPTAAVEDLAHPGQGLVTTEQEGDDLLGRLDEPFVSRALAETEAWSRAEDGEGFVHRLLIPNRN